MELNFTAAAPNELWLTDITERPTAEGKLYLQRRDGTFFSLLQKNVLDRQKWLTRQELRLAITTWIERTYLANKSRAVPTFKTRRPNLMPQRPNSRRRSRPGGAPRRIE